MDIPETINFKAQIYKVQTLVDGGLRITLDLPETALKQASQMIECKARHALLEIVALPVEPPPPNTIVLSADFDFDLTGKELELVD